MVLSYCPRRPFWQYARILAFSEHGGCPCRLHLHYRSQWSYYFVALGSQGLNPLCSSLGFFDVPFGFGSIFRFLLRNSKYTLYMGFYSNYIGDPEIHRFGWITSNIMVLIVSNYKKTAMKHRNILKNTKNLVRNFVKKRQRFEVS